METEDIVNELKHTRISLMIHAPIAFAMGYISYLLNHWVVGIIGIVVLVALGYAVEKMTKKKGMKWWFGNGLFIYLMFWLVSWTLFLNIWPY